MGIFWQCLICKSTWYILLSFESLGLSVHEKKLKINFQDDGHLVHPIGTILAFCDLQVILILPTKFKVNWSFASTEEFQNRFSRWPPWNDRTWVEQFQLFLIYFLSSIELISLLVQEKKRKIDFEDGYHVCMAAILHFTHFAELKIKNYRIDMKLTGILTYLAS